MTNDLLNLSEAAELLGVHPATVRAWADRGEIPMHKTAGGHRRFRRDELPIKAAATTRSQQTGIQLVVQNTVGRARLELTEGRLAEEGWYQQLDAAARQQLRHLAHHLLHLVTQYLNSDDPLTLTEARQVGVAYEQLGRACGLSLTDTVRAYLFFREFLSQTIYDMIEATGPQSPTDWGFIQRQVTTFTNEVLLALIDSHVHTLC
ncbi:MAG: helix-turn-helix domain-containing protein [Chloroflexi bacterium]|nr:helix-turn-helix domain-containing protein [Chloroflexota bacterium]MBP8055406.1 helix-turn-helix domain-containing protein [Chloroflexota bacterium]